MHRAIRVTYRTARRIAIAVVGATVVLLGIAMLVLPGPGLLTIVLGLMLLGVEFAFARRWLKRLKKESRAMADKVLRKVRHQDGDAGPASGPPPDPGDAPQDK